MLDYRRVTGFWSHLFHHFQQQKFRTNHQKRWAENHLGQEAFEDPRSTKELLDTWAMKKRPRGLFRGLNYTTLCHGVYHRNPEALLNSQYISIMMESNKGYIMQEFLQQDQLNGPLNLPEHLMARLQLLVSLEYGNPYPSFLGVITIYRANNLFGVQRYRIFYYLVMYKNRINHCKDPY